MMSLDQLIDNARQHAGRVLIGNSTEQVTPLFHIQFKDRPDAVMATPWRDEKEKSAMVAEVRAALKTWRRSVVNYAFLSEAWVAAQDHRPRPGDLPPSERETRRECVIVSAGDHDGARMKAWEIVRDGQGVVTDLVEDPMLPGHVEGRLFNLLDEDD